MGVSGGPGTKQCGLEGELYSISTHTPKKTGCTARSHRAQAGSAWLPGRGQGPQQRGRLCVQLPPVHRPHRGSPPHNYSIRRKITEQGGSLPAPFLATLPELPTAPPRHSSPYPPGTGPTATAPGLQPLTVTQWDQLAPSAAGITAHCASTPTSSSHGQPQAEGGGKGVAPAPSQETAPALPSCPGRGLTQGHSTSLHRLSAPLTLGSEGLGAKEPILGPAAPPTQL